MTYHRARSVAEFPEPHRFGVWWNQTRFKVYRNLSLVKSAITNETNYDGTVRSDVKIYEYVGESWELIYEIPRGSVKREHELWAKGPAPKTLAVSESSVEEAIDSILQSQRGNA